MVEQLSSSNNSNSKTIETHLNTKDSSDYKTFMEWWLIFLSGHNLLSTGQPSIENGIWAASIGVVGNELQIVLVDKVCVGHTFPKALHIVGLCKLLKAIGCHSSQGCDDIDATAFDKRSQDT
jgi:hypothetical protein